MNRHRVTHFTMIMTYISYVLLILIGHIRDQLGSIFMSWKYRNFTVRNRIPALFTRYESFFIRRLYRRIADCWNRPLKGRPGKDILILERKTKDHNKTFNITGNELPSLNTGSYNYLGFTDISDDSIEVLLKTIDQYGTNFAHHPAEHETHPLVGELEEELANFLHREAAIVFPVGYGTNTWVISALMTNSLILSDEYNHMSMIVGMRLSNSKVVRFLHNDMLDLENKLREHISQGQPLTHRAWSRVFVVVEGIYSMEGDIVDLEQLIQLKKKYKFYIYMDEAHSIGAMGYSGRGVCEHKGVDFKEIDLLMGTFSKNFASMGGYVASSRAVVNFLRRCSDGALFSEQIPPVCCAQILNALREIQRDRSRLRRLATNTYKIRSELKRLNFTVLGDEGSPVVPILIYTPGKIGEFSRLCLKLGVAVVVVGYPATPILLSRVRICVSSLYDENDVNRILETVDRVGTILGMKGA